MFLLFGIGLCSLAGNVMSDILGTELLKELVTEEKRNLVISPASIKNVLKLAALGAKSLTKEEFDTTLASQNEEDPQSPLELRALNPLKKFKGNLLEANVVLISPNLKIKKTFCDRVARFEAKTMEFNFNTPEDSVEEINSWISSKTNNIITDFLTPKDVDPNTLMMIVDAIYFKDKWKNEFNKDRTKSACFYPQPETCIKTDMMNMKGDFKFGSIQALGIDFLSLPYKTSTLSMVIVMPTVKGLRSLVSTLDVEKVFKYIDESSETYGFIALPKFEIEFSKEVTESLKKMGIKRAFNSQSADFSGITDQQVNLGKVIHKAKIICDEEGTTAAASSTANIMLRSSWGKEFKANKPFLFFIRHVKLGIIFAGSFVMPDS